MQYLITGGTTGIGKAVLDQLVMQGHTVYNLDSQPLAHPIENVIMVVCDVANSASVGQAVESITAPLDGIFINAGVHQSGSIEDLSFEQIKRVIDINLYGAIFTLKAFMPYVKDQGTVVLNGSDQTLVGKSNSFAYGLTKGAIGQMAKSLALDYAKRQIRVNAVCPGTIDTPLFQNAIGETINHVEKTTIRQQEAALQPLNRLGTPADVAQLVCFLLGPCSSFITGALMPIDGGYTAQ